jgi:sulfate adenylyltransferase large subunit
MDINAYLNEHENKSLLRLLTCGSVDDGKSTLIGRLLYDSRLIFEDQLAALKKDSDKNGTTGAGEIDYALLLDGLKAEREQGITIDVAYRYFATPKRKFIIADCPGHEQYTRNMATGASTADLAVILIDARYGVITQTRRHSFIVSLLGIRHVVVAVNKMDLVDYSEARFEEIRRDFQEFSRELDIPNLYFMPISALKGTNVVDRSTALTPYYQGPSLLELLETVDLGQDRNLDDFRFSVQYVIRPDLNFRGFAGTVASGVIRKDDEVVVLPSGKRSRIREIVTADGNLDYAFASQSVTLALADEIDVSCGDWIVKPDNLPLRNHLFRAHLIWMTQDELRPGKTYLLHHGSSFVKGRVREISRQIDVNTLERTRADALALNGIAEVVIETTRPICFDPYKRNRGTGRFILIDPVSNTTGGAGMIIEAVNPVNSLPSRIPGYWNGAVTPSVRAGSQRHRGGVVVLAGEGAPAIAAALEEKLFHLHVGSYALSVAAQGKEQGGKLENLGEIARAFADGGLLFITALPPGVAAVPGVSGALTVAVGDALESSDLRLEPGDELEYKIEKITGLLVEKQYLPDYRFWSYSI